jgi:hypothetical protein
VLGHDDGVDLVVAVTCPPRANGYHLRAECAFAGQAAQVLADGLVLIPLGQGQRNAAQNAVDQCAVGRGEIGEHLGGLVRPERMHAPVLILDKKPVSRTRKAGA